MVRRESPIRTSNIRSLLGPRWGLPPLSAQFGYAVYRMNPLACALLLFFVADDPRVQIANDAVRVLSVIDQPRVPSALHRHERNRAMVYLSGGDLTVRYQDGHMEEQHWKAGQVAWSPAGGLHISEDAGAKPLHIIEIELKKPASKPPKRDPKLDPVAIDPRHNILLFENAQVREFRSWPE